MITETELRLMAALATMGLNSIPNTGKRTPGLVRRWITGQTITPAGKVKGGNPLGAEVRITQMPTAAAPRGLKTDLSVRSAANNGLLRS